MKKLIGSAIIAFGLLAFGSHVPASSADTVTLKVGYSPGGSYDSLGRLLSQHLGNYLTGEPSIVVQNSPGAGSLALARLLLETEPADGSVLGMINPGVAQVPILEPEKADFDPGAFEWIGSLINTAYYCYTPKGSGIDTLEDFRNGDFLVGAPAKTSGSYKMAAVAKNLLGAKFKIVTGFPGAADVRAAIERGEIQSYCAQTEDEAIASGLFDKINFLLQFSAEDTELAPSYLRFASDDLDRRAASLVLGSLAFSHAFVLPPDTPESVVSNFREAFSQAASLPEFTDGAKKMGITIDISSGDEIEAYVADVLESDDDVVKRAREMIE